MWEGDMLGNNFTNKVMQNSRRDSYENYLTIFLGNRNIFHMTAYRRKCASPLYLPCSLLRSPS